MTRRERQTTELALSILQRTLSVKADTLQIDAVRLSLRVLLPYAPAKDLSDYWRVSGWKCSSQRRQRLGFVFERIAMGVRCRPGS